MQSLLHINVISFVLKHLYIYDNIILNDLKHKYILLFNGRKLL